MQHIINITISIGILLTTCGIYEEVRFMSLVDKVRDMLGVNKQLKKEVEDKIVEVADRDARIDELERELERKEDRIKELEVQLDKVSDELEDIEDLFEAEEAVLKDDVDMFEGEVMPEADCCGEVIDNTGDTIADLKDEMLEYEKAEDEVDFEELQKAIEDRPESCGEKIKKSKRVKTKK